MSKFSLVFFALLCSTVQAAPSEWKLAWKTDNLPSPESTVWDAKKEVIFISNQNYAVEKDGGSIGQLKLDGSVIAKEWVKGLNKPKGIVILGDTLYVSDVTELVEIDIPSASIKKRHPAKGAKFLNDVATDGTGAIYVSDMFNSSIYRFDPKGQFDIWMEGHNLENPNGILFHKGELYVAAWGPFTDGKPLSAPKGHFLKVNLKNKKFSRLTSAPLGNLDGIVAMGEEFLLSDWVAGGVFLVSSKGVATKIIETEQSAGDIAYLPEQDLILIPMAKQGQVLAYTRGKKTK